MTVSFEDFSAALRYPVLQAEIGLTISEADCAALISNPEQERNYYDQWVALQPPTPAAEASEAATPTQAPPVWRQPISAAAPSATVRRPNRSVAKTIIIVILSIIAVRIVLLIGFAIIAALLQPHDPPMPPVSSASSVTINGQRYSGSDITYVDKQYAIQGFKTVAAQEATGANQATIQFAANSLIKARDAACTSGLDLHLSSNRDEFIAALTKKGTSTTVTPNNAGKMWDVIVSECDAGVK